MSSETVNLTSRDGQTFGAYVTRAAKPNGGSVVVLQEIFGINANIRATTDQFAAWGFNAIAPDLFWRDRPGIELNPASEADREDAMRLMKGLDQALAVEDALVAAEFLRGLPGNSGKVGAVGYCLGGKLAFLMAQQAGIDAAVSYYGVAIQAALAQFGDVRAPLLLHIAEEDHLCPPEAQSAIEEASRNAGQIEVMRHPGVGHAFARIGGATYDATAATRADEATRSLLNRTLLN